MKVLLFSNDLMPFGNLPTSGGGLRCWQIKCGLESHGVEVISSMPSFTYLTEKHYAEIPREQRELLWNWGQQDSILAQTKPDAVIFASNWDHFNLTRPLSIPLIIDLHGSRLIETTMWGNPVDTDHKVTILSKADCLLTAGTRQRLYFYGWLVQAGRVPSSEHFIRYIPISLGPDMPEHASSDMEAYPQFVSGGGWFPWQNQSKAIFNICKTIESNQRGRIQIYGTPHETPTISVEEREIRNIYQQIKTLSESSARISVNGYVGRDQLIEIYRHADVAVEAMTYNLERELAFTTRTIEYLWCGLPVLYNDYSEISDHIREYDAGWAVNPESQQSLSAAIDEIFANPELVRKKSENAQRLVKDRFTWDKTILPLLDFLRHPVKAAVAEPAIGAIWARPSFLIPKGACVDVPILIGASLSQSFVLPADGIISLEVPISKAKEISEASDLSMEFLIKKANGAKVLKKTVPLRKLPNQGLFIINLPRLFSLSGGTELTLELNLHGNSSSQDNARAVVITKGLEKSVFPFQGILKTNTSQNMAATALAISFVPGFSPVSHAINLARRAWGMARHGQWTRLLGAIRRRAPLLVQSLKRI